MTEAVEDDKGDNFSRAGVHVAATSVRSARVRSYV